MLTVEDVARSGTAEKKKEKWKPRMNAKRREEEEEEEEEEERRGEKKKLLSAPVGAIDL